MEVGDRGQVGSFTAGFKKPGKKPGSQSIDFLHLMQPVPWVSRHGLLHSPDVRFPFCMRRTGEDQREDHLGQALGDKATGLDA